MANGFFNQFSGSSTLSEGSDKGNDQKRWGKQKQKNKIEKKKLKSLDSRLNKVEQKIDDTDDRLLRIEGFLDAVCQRRMGPPPDDKSIRRLKNRKDDDDDM